MLKFCFLVTFYSPKRTYDETQTALMSISKLRSVVAIAVILILGTSCSQNLAEKALKKAASLSRSASLAHSAPLEKEEIVNNSNHFENSSPEDHVNDSFDRLPMAAY